MIVILDIIQKETECNCFSLYHKKKRILKKQKGKIEMNYIYDDIPA